MAIFDTSAIHFDITDWRTQESTLFDNAKIVPWADNLNFYDRLTVQTKPGELDRVVLTDRTDKGVKYEKTFNYSVKLSDVHLYGQSGITQMAKTDIARLLGSDLTKTLLTLLVGDGFSDYADVDSGLYAFNREYYRRSTTKIILPVKAAKIDDNGKYKGFDVIYTPYLSWSNSKQNYGVILDTETVFASEYDRNGLTELNEERLDIGAVGLVGYYLFQVGVTDINAVRKIAVS